MSWYEEVNTVTASPIENKVNDLRRLWQQNHLWKYYMARDIGATHDQFMEAHKRNLNLNNYVGGLYANATHKELMQVSDAGYKHYGYNIARNNGISHKDALDALNQKIPLTSMVQALKNGATKNECMDAKKQKINLSNYASLRPFGSHEEVLDACKTIKAGFANLWEYRSRNSTPASLKEQSEVVRASADAGNKNELHAYNYFRAGEKAYPNITRAPGNHNPFGLDPLSHNELMGMIHAGHSLTQAMDDFKNGDMDVAQFRDHYGLEGLYDFAFDPAQKGNMNVQ
jgi:hypothetical protein